MPCKKHLYCRSGRELRQFRTIVLGRHERGGGVCVVILVATVKDDFFALTDWLCFVNILRSNGNVIIVLSFIGKVNKCYDTNS